MQKRLKNALVLFLAFVLICMTGTACGAKPTPAVDAGEKTDSAQTENASSQNFDQELSQIQQIHGVLSGERKADLFLKNVKIVDVYRESVSPGSILIDNGRIVAIDPDESIIKAEAVVDGQGQYALPGLIDGHFHFESQLVVPTELSGAMVPHGTTSIIAECCDFVSAAGDDALTAAATLFQEKDTLPYRIYPFAPGKKVGYETVKAMLDWEFILGLGEMNNINFANGDSEDFKKVAYTKSIGKMLDGHVDAASDHGENFFAAVNIMNDHDIWSGDSLENNLKLGLPSFLLYGMGRVTPLVTELLARKLPLDNIMFSTDNLAVEHMQKIGHMDACINEAMAAGLDPITAIKMCTYNTAKHFGLEEEIGSLTPGRYADIVLSPSLEEIRPTAVYQNGVLVAADGKLTAPATVELDYSSLEKPSTPGLAKLEAAEITAEPMELSADGTKAKVMVYNYYGFGDAGYFKEEWLPVKDGAIVPTLNGEALLYFAIVQRYAQGERIVHSGFLRQFPLERGAVTIAFCAPKPYVISFGTSPADMLAGIAQADGYNGAYVLSADEKILDTVPMDIYGMMTHFSVDELVTRSETFTADLKTLGHVHENPILMSLLELFYLSDRYGLLQ